MYLQPITINHFPVVCVATQKNQEHSHNKPRASTYIHHHQITNTVIIMYVSGVCWLLICWYSWIFGGLVCWAEWTQLTYNLQMAELTNEELNTLKEQSSKMREAAYAPYSNFRVGACIMDKNGKLFTGMPSHPFSSCCALISSICVLSHLIASCTVVTYVQDAMLRTLLTDWAFVQSAQHTPKPFLRGLLDPSRQLQ